MSVRKRILAIKLSEKLQKNPEYAKKVGVSVNLAVKQNKQEEKVEEKTDIKWLS